jgi:hypothetical protein
VEYFKLIYESIINSFIDCPIYFVPLQFIGICVLLFVTSFIWAWPLWVGFVVYMCVRGHKEEAEKSKEVEGE